MNIYSEIIEKLHVNLKPLYDLLRDCFNFHRNNELETSFQQTKTSITKDVTLTLPNTNHPFFIFVDSSSIGTGCVLFQMSDSDKGELDKISYFSNIHH